MIAIWIVPGIAAMVLTFVAVRWMVRYVMMLVSQLVVERKLTVKIVVRFLSRYEQPTIVVIGVMAWIVPIAAVAIVLALFCGVVPYPLKTKGGMKRVEERSASSVKRTAMPTLIAARLVFRQKAKKSASAS